MLVTVAALATTLLAQQPVDKPTLELYQQRFVFRTAKEVVRIPLSSVIESPPAALFRRDDNYAVWDERGLTARSGAWSFTTQLTELPTSSRFYNRDEILQTMDLVRRGVRTLQATGVSGARRLGNKAYFLARWDDVSGKAWEEALTSIDLDGPKPKPKVIGRFEGRSLATRPIDDDLALREGGLEVVTQSTKGWGVARFDPNQEIFSFRQLGDKIQSYVPLTATSGLFVESTPYGTTLAGEIDLVTGKRKLLFQGRGPARFVDGGTPRILIATSPMGRILVNTATGAETGIGSNDEVRRSASYVVVWSPASVPAIARIFNAERWTELATWRAK